MRRLITFACGGQTLFGTVDEAPSPVGLLIVSGGNEVRVGAHRGMARLAGDVAQAGHPVFRFDRRGVGDSEGDNGGFRTSAPDLAAALSAFREASPALRTVVAFGNCDAATALLLHRPAGIDHYVLANPWAFETQEGMPPPAAVKARYRQQLTSAHGWRRLLTGGIDLRKLLRGLASITAAPSQPSLLAEIAAGIAALHRPPAIIVAMRDATGLAFADAMARHPLLAPLRERVGWTAIDSASHSFATEEDYEALRTVILAALADIRT